MSQLDRMSLHKCFKASAIGTVGLGLAALTYREYPDLMIAAVIGGAAGGAVYAGYDGWRKSLGRYASYLCKVQKPN